MEYGSFSEGYREADPNVTEDQINQAWAAGDRDGNGSLSRREFMDLFEMGQRDAEAQQYWDGFSNEGMMNLK